MRPLTPHRHPDLIIGNGDGDDALVWRRPGGRALIATVDVFSPIVDDPYTWGRIAAVNAASDVYAMGGEPLFALAIAAWPRDELPLELLSRVLAGGADAAADNGWVVGGGHSIDGPEPVYGQAVIGEADLDVVTANRGAKPGDVLILTKPLGTGVITTAVKRLDPAETAPGGLLYGVIDAAVASMTRTNRAAAQAARAARAHAVTDVTGFGLLGHLHEMLVASGVAADIDPAAVPRFDRVGDLIAAGHVPGGTQRNLAFTRPFMVGAIDEQTELLLADPQTSGGLLLAVEPTFANQVLDALAPDHTAAVIGRVTGNAPGTISLDNRLDAAI